MAPHPESKWGILPFIMLLKKIEENYYGIIYLTNHNTRGILIDWKLREVYQMNTSQLSRISEDEARTMLENIRWANGPMCPHCGNLNVIELSGSSTRPGVKKCRDCRRQFTVTVGTIFESSHIPLRNWVYAFGRMCASKKGISALQLQRELGITYKTAWFMSHRIRCTMQDTTVVGTKLSGTVEVDETYVGGKPRYKGQSKRGRGTKKTPVLALIERNGNARTHVICNVTSNTLKNSIRKHIDSSARIMTDDNPSYRGIGAEFEGGHEAVKHSVKEYARKDGANINTAESYFAIMKRGIYGTFHHVSTRHLPRYCDEFDFRWNRGRLLHWQ